MTEFEYQPPVVPPPRSPSNEVWRGLGLVCMLHLVQVPLAIASSFVSLILIGLSQLVYIIPAIIMARRRGRPGIVKGLIIGASITFLLNAACTGLVLYELSSM